MLLMYSATSKQQYLDTSRHAMDMLDEALYNYEVLDHDAGFIWNISSGADYRLTGDKKQRNRFMLAANSLMSRYNKNGGFIRAWNREGFEGYAIIDCMMNLPLLYRASETVGDDRYKMIAISHANTTMQYHIRPDGSCNHINEYDPINGGFVRSHTGQGYDGYDKSSWSRGQAWGLYGFVLSYIFTKNEEYLDVAKRIAHYFISNLAASDWLPLSDFRAPKEPVIYDSTAGACAAAGLIELAKNVNDLEQGIYIKAALNILKAMEKSFCNWEENEDSILQMGTEEYNIGKSRPIIYGDFFFTEAIYKLKGFEFISW